MTTRYFRPTKLADPYPQGYAGQEVYDLDFLDPLIVRRQVNAVKMRHGSDDTTFIVDQPYRITYRLRGEDQPRTIEVPRGMLTDLSSVPRFFRRVISQIGAHLEASIVHDFLYVAWQDLADRPAPRPLDQLFADRVLRAGMIDARGPCWKRHIIYWGVRLFGWGTFAGRNALRYYDFWSPGKAHPAAALAMVPPDAEPPRPAGQPGAS